MMNSNYYAILMAGGVGSRFWPVSTAKRPKQFLDILGVGVTLLQTTFNRLSQLVPKENIIVLTNSSYEDLVKEQLPGISGEQIVLEPVMKNTAPSILMGALKILKKDKEALMVVAPSDHWIENQEAFIQDLRFAFDSAKENERLITLGTKPTFPNTGYGYIKFDKEASGNLKKVLQFTEKPDYETAREFMQKENFLWNTGIFVWSASGIIENFRKYLPELYELLSKGAEVWNTSEENNFIAEHYHKAEKVSIDNGIMEKSDEVFVVPVKFDWNDLGTWGSLQEELPQDDTGNTVVNAQLLPMKSGGNVISTGRPKVVVIEGLNDYIVVENDDVLLITPKKNEQKIKEIREQVMKKFGDHLG